MSILKAIDITFGFDQKSSILRNCSFDIGQNEFISLVGLSGCGKSTVLKLIAGLYPPREGRIEYAHGGQLGKIGFMPQQDLLMPWRSVLENAALPMEIQGVNKREAQCRVLELLPIFGLQGYENAYPFELSGGMRQRVSFLRCVLTGHQLLLLDEPFSALDALTRREMQLWLTETWQKWKQSVLLVTHDLDEALLLSDRIFVMTSPQEGPFYEIKVPFLRPRQPSQVYTKEWLDLKEKMTTFLYKKREIK